MENSQTCAKSATRDDEEEVSKRQDGEEDEEAEETPEDAGVDDDEDGNEVASDMGDPCSVRTESATRKHHPLTRQRARGRRPALPHRWLEEVHEEIVTQMNQCIKKSRPQDDLITIRVGTDDSCGSCEAICVECKGTRGGLGVKAIAILARSLSQPHLRTRNDGEHSAVEEVRQTCDELPI